MYDPFYEEDATRLLLSFTASRNVLLDVFYITNSYLHGSLDVSILNQQPNNSSGILAVPVHNFLLRNVRLGSRKFGRIGGAMLHDQPISWGFSISSIEPRLYL